VSAEFPEPDSTDGVVAERDRVLDRVRETCSVMAGDIYRYEGDDYGTFTARRRRPMGAEVGRGGRLVPPSGRLRRPLYPLAVRGAVGGRRARVRRLVPGFVDAYNEFVATLESDLAAVEL